jgi:cytoskeletal protein CcmA (bactofilin family)
VFKRRKPDETPQGTQPAPSSLAVLTEGLMSGGQPGLLEHGGAPTRPADSGLGVPPFRPAPPKEAQVMGRPPFSPTPAPASPPQNIMPGAPGARAPGSMPGAIPGRPAGRDPTERRTLVVGRGISVQGIVQDAERLVVEGTVEATMIHAAELSISPGGVFKGEVEVEDAEVAGTIDGTLTARGNLIVRATGRVLGTARCRRLQVEDGGQITGRIEMLTEPARPAEGRIEAGAA